MSAVQEPKEATTRRTQEQWDELARLEIVPALQAGASLKEVAERHAKGYTNAIRKTLTRLGYDSKGQPLEIAELSAPRPGLLAGKIAKRRKEGASWRELEQATGKSTAEMKALLISNGYEGLTRGRVGSADDTEEAAA